MEIILNLTAGAAAAGRFGNWTPVAVTFVYVAKS
jgi:hypothetical protein